MAGFRFPYTPVPLERHRSGVHFRKAKLRSGVRTKVERGGKKRDCSFLVPPPLPPPPPPLLLLGPALGGRTEEKRVFLHTQSPPKQTPTQSLVLLLGSLVKRPAASHGNGGVEIGRGKNGILVAKSLDCISGADFFVSLQSLCVHVLCTEHC